MGFLGSILGSTIGSAVSGAFQALFNAFAGWAAQGAGWLLTQIGHVMSSTTTVDLGSTWFTEHERAMAALSAAVLLPMALCGAMVAVYRQDASLLVRGFLVKLPLALLFTGVSVELVRIGLSVTDALSSYVLSTGSSHTTDLIGNLGAALSAGSLPVSAVGTFVMFIGAVLLAIAALVLWLELVVRAAAVAAATLFLPLALAGLVWPATAHWCRRLGETIAALVLSKLVIAAVLSLGAGAITAGIGGPSDTSGGFSSVVVGIALLGVATFSPFALLRLVPAMEAGAVAHLESVRHRLPQLATAPVRGFNLAMQAADGAGMLNPRASGLSGPGSGIAEPLVLAGTHHQPGSSVHHTRGRDGEWPGAEDGALDHGPGRASDGGPRGGRSASPGSLLEATRSAPNQLELPRTVGEERDGGDVGQR